MISKDEIDEKSRELAVHTSNVQRDYVFGWLLSGLHNVSEPYRDRLILKGGNAFRKGYFEHARYSNDLDFSTQTDINPVILAQEINKICGYVGDMTKIKFVLEDNAVGLKRGADSDNKVYEAKVCFKGFYGEERYNIKVKMDIKEFDRIFLPVQERNIIHSYSDAEDCTGVVMCHKLEELLGSKLKALLQRRHSPDLYDFIFSVFLQNTLDVNRREVVSTFLRKTIYQPSPMVARNLLLELPFQTFKAIWDRYLVCPKQSVIAFDEAESKFKGFIPELFGLLQPAFGAGGGTRYERKTLDYFSAAHRNTIMEAGRMKKMVKLLYKGLTRIVEPYSLTYKVRQDGVGREYFYGWDITGGTSGKVGIKSYTENNVQAVEITDREFEPRFPIELSKAGEHFGKTYFSRPFSTTTHPSPWGTQRIIRKQKGVTGRRTGSGMSYTLKCPICDKTFKRSTYNTKLNKHKDKFGNQCYGRIGHFI